MYYNILLAKPYGLANQMLCYISICGSWRKRQRIFLRMLGEYCPWWLWIRDPVEAKFLSGVFSPLTSAEACEKCSRWLWKESCVSNGVGQPGNTCVSPTAIICFKNHTINQGSKKTLRRRLKRS